MSPDGRIAVWSVGAECLTGYAPEDVISRSLGTLFVPDDQTGSLPDPLLATARREGVAAGMAWLVRRDGARLRASLRIEAARDGTDVPSGFLAVLGDMADAPSEDPASYRALVKSITDYAIYMLDPQGRVASWNPGAARTKGYAAQEILGRTFACFYTPEDRQAGLPARALEEAATWGRHEAEGWRVRKDGSRFWASIVIHPMRDPDGRVTGFAKVTRDISDRLTLERTKEELRRSQRLEALGQLAGSIAHDFNDVLTAVAGGLDLIAGQIGDRPLRHLVRTAQQAVGRGTHLTSQLLAFSRHQAPEARGEESRRDAASGTPPGDAAPPQPGPAAAHPNRVILVVEDDPEVLDIAVESLKGFGYQVYSAGNGPEALTILRRDVAIDVLFTDIVMPEGMNGVQLAEEARRVRPELRVLLCSGYAREAFSGGNQIGPDVEFIAKPYRLPQLEAKLRELAA